MTTTVIGENPIQQQYNDTCAIKSQQLIMQDFGIPVTEDQLVEWSVEHGLYTGNGTQMSDIGTLLNETGIPVTHSLHADVFDLTNELAQGHKIIVGVDSGELWARDKGIWEQFKEWWEDLWGNEIPDHALIVSSIDNSNPNDPQVVLTDPGTGEIRHYPLDQFMDAWKDSGCFMVSTDVAPAEFAANQLLNDQPSTTHLSEVAGVSYDDFQLFHDMSNALPPMDVWDYANQPVHPVHSLMDAYFQYGQDTIGFAELHNFDFYPHLNVNIFVHSFGDTFANNMDLLSQNHQSEMMDFSNYLHQHQDIDSLYTFFENQADDFNGIGNIELADFYQQQVHYLDMCQNLDINPVDVYDSSLFNF